MHVEAQERVLNPKYGTLGFIAMPNVWIFQVFFPLISPMMDLMFVWTLVRGPHQSLEHQQEYAHTPTNLNQVIFYYALFPRGRLVRCVRRVPDGKERAENACSGGC